MDYSRQIATADRLIRKYGTTAGSYTSAPTDYAAWLPTEDSPGTPRPNTPLVQVNAGVARYFKEIFNAPLDDTLGSLQMLMPGDVPFTPGLRDYIAWPDGSQYAVKDFDVIAPDATPILYLLTLSEVGVTS